MLKRFRRDKRGVLYLYMVIILSLFACAFIWYVMGVCIQAVQEGTAASMASDKWVSNETYATFTLANTFVDNFWVYFLVLFVLGLLYYGYIFSQRKGVPDYG